MRNTLQLAAALVLLVTQVQDPFTSGATDQASASADSRNVYEVRIDTTRANGVVVDGPAKPNYDTEVLSPLKAAQAAQAAAAAEAAAKAAAVKKKVATKVATVTKAAATPANMLALRLCEAGNIYARNSGNGYYGAYQFNIGTWAGYGGFARADLAPAEVQDAKFLETFARRGWSPWPACARKLGLM